MIDWTKIKNPAIADRVREEGRFMMQRCHFGVQGIAKTEQDVKLALDRLMQTGFKPMAFDTEMNFVPMLKELTQGEINLHCAVSYPLGRMTLKKKMQDLETLLQNEIFMTAAYYSIAMLALLLFLSIFELVTSYNNWE